jgi:hypothetical protein
MRHDPHLYVLCGAEEISNFMENAYLEKDYSLKITELPWPEDYYTRTEEFEDKVYTVGFDDWSLEFKAAKARIERDKMVIHSRTVEKERKIRNKKLKRLILYLYCKNILFQMAFLYYQFAYELGYKPPHKAYFRILTVLFMRIWASIEN